MNSHNLVTPAHASVRPEQRAQRPRLQLTRAERPRAPNAQPRQAGIDVMPRGTASQIGPHIPPDIRAALVAPRVLVAVPVAQTPRRARKPRTQMPRARRPRAAGQAHVLNSNASGDGAQGLTTRQSYPHPFSSGDDTSVQALTRRQTLHSGHGGFGEPGRKVKHPPPVQTTGGRQVVTLVCHATRRLAGHTEETRAGLAPRPSLWSPCSACRAIGG